MSMGAGVLIPLMAGALPSAALAQDYTSGSITGRVVDASGKPVAGATVTITSSSQGTVRTAKTNNGGSYLFSGLPAGDYELKVEASGFASAKESGVTVEISKSIAYDISLSAQGAVQEVVVTGSRKRAAFSGSTTGVVIDVENLTKDVPVSRNLTALVLMSPGTVGGDSAFGNLASIGGSSVAENAYYFNGMNITDFNKYLGSSYVPFDFIKAVEVKNGGYPAEFGRATGGVVNQVSKSGSNNFKAALHFNYTPNSLREKAPDIVGKNYDSKNNVVDELWTPNHWDYNSSSSTSVELGGPILKDKLFFYYVGEYNKGDTRDGDTSGGMSVAKSNNMYHALKLDGYITENHHLEATYFDNTGKTRYSSYEYNVDTGEIGNVTGVSDSVYGDPSYVFKYTGRLTDWFTLSAAYGKNNDKSESIGISGSAFGTYVSDGTSGRSVLGRPFGNAQRSTTRGFPQRTERTFSRVDGDLFFSLLGDHHVRVGFEREENLLEHFTQGTGDGIYYIYSNCGTSARCSTGSGAGLGLTSTSAYVRLGYYKTGGAFKSQNDSYYIQDEWKVTDRLTLNLGVRLDEFNNFTANGSQYVDLNELTAPRVGFNYTLGEERKTRVYGFYGTYYLPIAGNTAYRQGAQEYFFSEYWTFSGTNSDGTPILAKQLTNWTGGVACPLALTTGSVAAGSKSCAVTGSGQVQDPTSSLARNLEATKEDEIILGVEHKLTDLWTLGLTYTSRDLKQTAEDAAIDAAVIAYCKANKISGCENIWSGFHQYTILNPGVASTIVLNSPLPGETTQRTVTFSASDLGYPKATRKYEALEFTFKRAFDGKWGLNGSYTLSSSKGNSEGYVQSDFGQSDAGITQDFDQPGFTVGATGYLPNHRKHKLKLWGSYKVTDKLSVGTQLQVASPRKLSCWGYYPAKGYINFENDYGAASHFCMGKEVPRGTGLETDWIYNMDMSVRYETKTLSGPKVTLRADVFNLFNRKGVQERYETGESTQGIADPSYGVPTSYQSPRYVRLGFDINL